MLVVASCYPHKWVAGLACAAFIGLGGLLLWKRRPIAQAFVTDFMLSWWKPEDPEERKAGVEGWSTVTGGLLGFFGIAMIAISILALVGTLDCHE